MRSTPLLLVILLAACGSDTSHEQVDITGCARFATGPFQDLTPGSLRDTTAPEITEGVAYRIELGTTGGFVFVGAGFDGDRFFFLDADVGIEYTNQAGDVIAPSATASGSSACSEVRLREVVPLAVGTYFLELAPDAAEVTLVVATEDRDAGL